ncbi:TPA: hypothetical protein ACM5DY_004483 [Escherichia coli]
MIKTVGVAIWCFKNKWELHFDDETIKLIGHLHMITGTTKDELLHKAKDFLDSRNIDFDCFVTDSEYICHRSAQENALLNYRDRGGEMPMSVYLWG